MSSGTKRSQEAKEANELHIQNMFEAYFQDVAKSKRVIIALNQQRAQQYLHVLQKLRLEMHEEMSEMAANIYNVDITNIIHAAKIKRMANNHLDKAKKIRQ